MHFDNVGYEIVGRLKAKKAWVWDGGGERRLCLSFSWVGSGCGWEGRKGVAEKELGRTVQLRKVEKQARLWDMPVLNCTRTF